MSNNRHQGFPPVVDARIHTLVLGSFPSIVSLSRSQYYAHPQNQFWRLMGAVLGEALPQMDYESRKRMLLAHRIGLWDIIATCSRKGSLDSSIRNAGHNDYAQVLEAAPGLRRVCFNGKTAARKESEFAQLGYETLVLPSSSPAFTLSFDEKLAEWHKILLPLSDTRARIQDQERHRGVSP